MKVLILAPYPPTIAPSQRFRFEQYLAAFKAEGWSYDYEPFLDFKTWQVLYREGYFFQKVYGEIRAFVKRFTILFRLKEYDYVFIHREASHLGPPIFEFLISKVFRKKIIYDFDDAVWLPNYSQSNRTFHYLKFYGKVRSIMRWSYKISAGNEYLSGFAQRYNKNVVLNPTTIDTEGYHNSLKDQLAPSKLIIGWTGTMTNIKYLDRLVPILAELEKKYDFEFCVISNRDPEYPLKSFKFLRWQKETEIEDLSKFNMGLMPLEEDPWALGKCGFKALQYMSLGIPALVSPVGVNLRIVDHAKNGFICDTDEDWTRGLTELLTNHQKRFEMGQKAREKIVKAYSVRSNTENFLRLFS